MTVGRKPLPTHLKLVKGNPGHRPVNKEEAKPKGSIPGNPYPWMSTIAKREWKRLRPELEKLGLLWNIDSSAFAAYCEAYSDLVTATKFTKKNGQTYELNQYHPKKKDENGDPVLLRVYRQQHPEVSIRNTAMKQIRAFASEFGMSPSSRGRIEVSKPGGEKDPYEQYKKEQEENARRSSTG